LARITNIAFGLFYCFMQGEGNIWRSRLHGLVFLKQRFRRFGGFEAAGYPRLLVVRESLLSGFSWFSDMVKVKIDCNSDITPSDQSKSLLGLVAAGLL
jgi:hypothetical protein